MKKELVDLTEYLNQTMDIEKARLFVSNFKNYEAIFSKYVLTKALSNFRVKDFATFEAVPIEHSRYYEERYPRYSNAHLESFSDYVYKNGIAYEARIQKSAYSYIVPNHHQLNEKKFLEACLVLTIPEIDKFKWDMYHLNSYEDNKTKRTIYSDIYLKTSEGSLYCPVEALVNYDKESIIERHTSYHKGYYNTSDRKKYLEKSLSVLDTLEVELLFYILDCYKNKKEVDFIGTLSPEGKKFLERVQKEKIQKANKNFVLYSLKDTVKSVIPHSFFSIDYLIEDEQEYVVVTLNEKTIKTNITGLTHRDIVRYVLFDIGE